MSLVVEEVTDARRQGKAATARKRNLATVAARGTVAR